ncbi:hypothetical protein VTH06DRAFT_2112 [Thermothelomyces fergusii]
MLNLDFC